METNPFFSAGSQSLLSFIFDSLSLLTSDKLFYIDGFDICKYEEGFASHRHLFTSLRSAHLSLSLNIRIWNNMFIVDRSFIGTWNIDRKGKNNSSASIVLHLDEHNPIFRGACECDGYLKNHIKKSNSSEFKLLSFIYFFNVVLQFVLKF